MTTTNNVVNDGTSVFDLDALTVEHVAEPFPFQFGGETYTLPRVFDIRVTALLNAGDWGGAIRTLVGHEQWERIVASEAVFTLDQAVALVNAYTAYLGTTPEK